MTKRIPLTQGKFALVDDEDYEELNKHKWYAHNNGRAFYAIRQTRVGGKQITVFMHRQILGLSPGDGKEVDHKNRSGLDNKRSNLRIISHMVNCRNRSGHKNNASGHNGVCWLGTRKKWQARIGVDGRDIYLGIYPDIADAIEARKQGEIIHWGGIRT